MKRSCESLCEAVSLLFGEIPVNRYIVTNQDSMPYINNLVDEDLLNVEEFEAPDYVLAQLNAVSGEASVSTGLKFGFEKVEGSDRPVLVIKGTFNGLGPVALASKAE